MSRSKSDKKIMKPLQTELRKYQKLGIALFLDGQPSSPKNIARACTIAEGGGYMRDYTEDEKGRIAKVEFNFVNIL